MAGALFDVNVWVALVFETHPFHSLAKSFLEKSTVETPIIFSRSTQQSFLRLITTLKLLKYYGSDAITNREALFILRALLNQSNISEREEPLGTAKLWHQIGALDTSSPKVWMDAYLAAFAISGKYKMITLDRDFDLYRSHGLDLLRLNAELNS